MRHQGSRQTATHNSDTGVVLTRQHRISLFGSCGVRKPQRSSEAQPLLRRAQRRLSDDGPTAFTSAYARGSCRTIAQTASQSASDSGASAGPEITSPVGLKREP